MIKLRCHDFDEADALEVEHADMAAVEVPQFELIVHVVDSPAALDVEELGVHAVAIQQHVVGLKTGCTWCNTHVEGP